MLFKKLQNPTVTFSWYNAYDINVTDSPDLENPERYPPLYGLAKLKLEIGGVVTIGNQGQLDSFERKRLEYYLKNDIKSVMKYCSNTNELEQLYDDLINLIPQVSFAKAEFCYDKKKKFEYDDFAHWERADSELRPLESYVEHFKNKENSIRKWLQVYFNRRIEEFLKKTIVSPVFQKLYKDNIQRLSALEVVPVDEHQAESYTPTFTWPIDKMDAFNDLFNHLKKNKLIASTVTRSQFNAVFGMSKSTEKIQWFGTVELLSCFLRNLPELVKKENTNHFMVGAAWFEVDKIQIDSAVLNRNNRNRKNNPKHVKLVEFLKNLEKHYM